jgi:hypothetical protein
MPNLEFLSTFSSFTARPFTITSSHSYTVGDRTLIKETGVKTCTDRLVGTSRSSVAGLSGSQPYQRHRTTRRFSSLTIPGPSAVRFIVVTYLVLTLLYRNTPIRLFGPFKNSPWTPQATKAVRNRPFLFFPSFSTPTHFGIPSASVTYTTHNTSLHLT